MSSSLQPKAPTRTAEILMADGSSRTITHIAYRYEGALLSFLLADGSEVFVNVDRMMTMDLSPAPKEPSIRQVNRGLIIPN